MDNNFGVKISLPGTNVLTTTGANVIFNTKDPFIKIDTTNPVGFQTILLQIITDPPEPVGPSWNNTYSVVYKFAHGYKYTPSLETLFFLSNPPPGAVFTQTYYQDVGQIAQQTASDGALLYAVVDATNVYFIVEKFNDSGLGSANLLTGTVAEITCHVFVDDLSGM